VAPKRAFRPSKAKSGILVSEPHSNHKKNGG
jgi:hypothetical protein